MTLWKSWFQRVVKIAYMTLLTNKSLENIVLLTH